MTRDVGDSRHPSPPIPIPDWRRFQGCHPKSRQIGVAFGDWDPIGVGLKNVAALCLYLQPGTLPPPPMSTHFHPRSPNPPKNRQRVATQKHKTQRNPRCGFCCSQIPSTTYQVPVNRYPSASLSLSHARTSSPAEDMSFATLCLTLVHVFGTWLGQVGTIDRDPAQSTLTCSG